MHDILTKFHENSSVVSKCIRSDGRTYRHTHTNEYGKVKVVSMLNKHYAMKTY
jgi:hypothetical protein